MSPLKHSLPDTFLNALFVVLLFLIPFVAKAVDSPPENSDAQKLDWRTVDLEIRAYSPAGNGLSAFGGDTVLDPGTYGVSDTKSAVARLKYCGWVDRRRILAAYQHEAQGEDKEAQFRYALMILRFAGCGEECPEAIRMLELAAGQRFAPAIYVLGLCHEKAIGCFIDHKTAAKWYSQLIDDPTYHEKAILGLAACYIKDGKCREAEKLLQPLVACENAEALFLTYKSTGKGVGNADSQKIDLLKQAHKKGSLEASCELGEYYWICGFSEEPSTRILTKKIPHTLDRAVKANHPKALWLMSLYYHGMDERSAEAWDCAKRAAEFGNVYERNEIATFEIEGKDEERAFQWLRPCVLKKDSIALYLAGRMLLSGQGVQCNIPRGYYYLTMAKECGYDAKECDKILQSIPPRELYMRLPEEKNTEGKSQQDDGFSGDFDFQIVPGSSFARFLDVLGSIQDSTDSFEALEQKLSRIKPTESNVGRTFVSADEMSFLLALFKLEFCSILRKGRKTIMYAEQLEWILQHKKIDIGKLSQLLLGTNLNAMKEIGFARAEIIKGAPGNAIPRIKALMTELAPSSPEYHMAQYTLGCLYLRAGDHKNSAVQLKAAIGYFARSGFNAYTAIAARQMALTCDPFEERERNDGNQWQAYAEDLAQRTNSTLVRAECLLRQLSLLIAWQYATDEIKKMPQEKKRKIISQFDALKKEFLAICLSDYYLRTGYLFCAEFEAAFGYPPEIILDDIEKYFMYKGLLLEGANVGGDDTFLDSIADKLKGAAFKNLAETGQLERLNFWTLQFEKLRVRERAGSDKMSLLGKMVSRLENANQIVVLEESKPPEQRDQKLLSMAREVKKELESYFDSVKYRLGDADRKKLEKILSNSFVIDPKAMRQLRGVLPEGVACVQIIPVGDNIITYMITRDRPPYVSIVSLPQAGLSERKLTALVVAARSSLAQEGGVSQVQTYLQKLYGLLWHEIEQPLQQMKITKVIVNSSGVLRYLPLAALYDGKRYLVEKYQVTNMTGLDLIRLTKSAEIKRFTDISAVVFADPDGSLPAARIEGKQVAEMFLNKHYYVGEKASLGEFESLLKNSIGKVNFIHLATHAILNPNAPEDSYVLFAHGDKWCYDEMNDFSVKDVDSFVLSACSTAVGEKSTGSEIEGMAYNLLCNSPAGSVLASFWRVNDEATAILMGIYYKHIVDSIKAHNTLDRGGALREAQLKLLHNPATSHPYYWAAFTLFGDFR